MTTTGGAGWRNLVGAVLLAAGVAACGVAANDPAVGAISGASDVELAVDPYFPRTIGTVSPELKGRTIHAGGRNRVFLDGHVRFTKDARTPLQ